MSYDPQRAPIGLRIAAGFRLLREDETPQWRVRIKVVPWPVPEHDRRFDHNGVTRKIIDEGREASILLERDRIDVHVVAEKAAEKRERKRVQVIARRERDRAEADARRHRVAARRNYEVWRRNYDVCRVQPLKQPIIPGTMRAWEWLNKTR